MSNGEEDFNALATRMSVWHAASLEIPNEREIIQWPVEGDDAARVTRIVELTGDLAAAVGRGHGDVFDELAKIVAACTIWAEALAQR